MNTKKHNQLNNIRKIALVGFAGPSQAMLEYCFSSAVDCELVNANSALILVVNGDQAEKDADVQAQINEKYRDAFKLVISIRDISWDGFVLLKKPHSSSDLLDAIRAFEIEEHIAPSTSVAAHEKQSEQAIKPGDVDFYRGGEYSKKRQGEALKQKLMRGNLVVSASDRLVKQLEDEIIAQEAELHAQLEAEKLEHTKKLLAKKKALKIKELKLKKLQKKRLEKARIEQERLEQELLEKEKLEKEHLKRERQKERLEKERLEKERLEKERLDKERLKQEREKQHLASDPKAKTEPPVVTVEASSKTDENPSKESVSAESPEPLTVETLVSDDAKRKAHKEYVLSDEEVLQRCGNAGDVDLSKKVERRSVFLNAEDSLLVKITEAIELAAKLEQPVEITGLPGKMFFFPAENVFYSTFSDDFLNQLALTRFGYKELDLEPQAEFELEDKGKHLAEGAETLIWKVAIWTARGRLFNGMDPEKLLQLSTKPDFERFLTLPNCEAISDVWAGHSLSALDIVRILDVPQRVVFAFMSGAYSLGWFQE